MVTTAIFWKYHPEWLRASLIGFIGTIPVCAVSDILIPYLGGVFFGTPIVFHFCIISEPWLVFPFCILGIVFGIFLIRWVEKGTEMTHLLHVLVSSLASLLYLVTYDVSLWAISLWMVFMITLVAVWIPCCLSDIVLPLLFIRPEDQDKWKGHCHH